MIRFALPLAVLLSAASSLAVELAIVRLGAPYLGQSLLPWSAAIASVLLGLTAGHVLGGLAGGEVATSRALRGWLSAMWLAAGVAAMAMPALIGPVATVFAGDDGFGIDAVAAIAALAAPPSFAAGFVSPLALRLAARIPSLALPRMVGAIYAASAVGSVAGTALAGFVVLERFGAAGLAMLAGGVWLLLGALALPVRKAAIAAPVYGLVLAAIGVLPWLGGKQCLVESRYTCVRLLDKALAGGDLLRFMILDEGVHSASDRDHPQRLHLGYAALANRLAQAAFEAVAVPRALVLGGGGATLPRAWAHAKKPVTGTVIELDAEVATLARDIMWAGRSDHLETLIGDGRAVLRALSRKPSYDVVLMDAYRSRSVPPHLVTAEFAREVAARLTSSGVYLSNVIDRADPPLLALSIATTLMSVFPSVDLWVAETPNGGITNVVVAAWLSAEWALRPPQLTVDATMMDAGDAVRTQAVTWRRLDLAAARSRWPRACAAILTDDWTPVDRLLAGRAVCHQEAARQ
ncbi:fused MFS/spermidine synthase [Nitrobacteraceae bacterium UC4446_H13]